MTVTDANGCQIQETITLIGNPLPVPIAGDPQEVCLGEMASIESLTAGGAECEWFFDNGMYLNDCGPVDVYFDDVGCYSANLVVTDGNGCIDSIWVQDMVCIAPLPTAGFTVDNAIVDIIYNEVNFTNTSTLSLIHI